MDKSAFLVLLQTEMKSLADQFVNDDWNNAVSDAERETGWALPQSTDFRIYWLKQRSKRHLFFYLATENAHKFKFEQVNLQHRFDHYVKLYQDLDTEFKEIMESRPDEFAGVEAFHLFGTKIDAGFQYDPQTGIDTTYSEDNLVEFGPKEND